MNSKLLAKMNQMAGREFPITVYVTAGVSGQRGGVAQLMGRNEPQMPGRDKRYLGTYETPKELGEAMAEWSKGKA